MITRVFSSTPRFELAEQDPELTIEIGNTVVINIGNHPHILARGEGFMEVDRVILVMCEATRQAGLAAAIVDVGDETGGVVAVGSQEFGECRDIVTEGRGPVGPELMGPPSGEEAGVGRERPGGCRERQVEAHAAAGQPLEVGGRRPAVAVEAEIARPHRIPDDQKQIPGGRGRGGQGGNQAMLRPGATAHRDQHQGEERHREHGDRPAHHSEKRRAAATDHPGELRGEPRREDWRRPQLNRQPRSDVADPNKREEPHGHFQANPSLPAPREEREPDRRYQEEDRDSHWDQPREIISQAVEVRLDEPLPRHEDAEVKKALDESDPRGQEQDLRPRHGGRMCVKGCLAQGRLAHGLRRVSRQKLHRLIHRSIGDSPEGSTPSRRRACKTRRGA
jgi:hypothetical protein